MKKEMLTTGLLAARSSKMLALSKISKYRSTVIVKEKIIQFQKILVMKYS